MRLSAVLGLIRGHELLHDTARQDRKRDEDGASGRQSRHIGLIRESPCHGAMTTVPRRCRIGNLVSRTLLRNELACPTQAKYQQGNISHTRKFRQQEWPGADRVIFLKRAISDADGAGVCRNSKTDDWPIELWRNPLRQQRQAQRRL